MVAKSGDRLLRPDAVEALKERLLPLATLITPNLPEAGDLLGLEAPADEAGMIAAAAGAARARPARGAGQGRSHGEGATASTSWTTAASP